jgi:hypothetical protein
MEVKSDPKLWATVTILVAIIGCIGVIGAAIIAKIPASTPTPILIIVTETPIPAPINLVPTDVPTDNPVLSPTVSPTSISIPTPTKIPINSLNRLAILTWFQIPRETLTSVDRLDVIYRQSRSSSLVTIPDYPLLPQYTLDDYGYLFDNGQSFDYPIGNNVGNLLNIDYERWQNYLGVFDFVIPADKNLQFCGFFIRSAQYGLNWDSTQRFIYSDDITSDFKIERASWLDIKDCYDVPSNNWAKRNAQNAASSSTTDSVYYWDKSSNTWVQLK